MYWWLSVAALDKLTVFDCRPLCNRREHVMHFNAEVEYNIVVQLCT